MIRRPVSVLLAVLTAAAPLTAQNEWFPQGIKNIVAADMVERFAAAGVKISGTPEESQEQAVKLLEKLAARLEEWDTDGIVSHAPELPDAGLPTFENPIIASIATYGACSLPLHPEFAETREERIFVVIGETAVVVVSAYLRHQFLSDGGSDQQLKQTLDTDAMNQASLDIQVEELKRQYVVDQCAPTFEALFAE